MAILAPARLLEKKSDLVISPARIVGSLARVAFYLTLASVAGEFCKYFLRHDSIFDLVPLFNLRVEYNIPTWYQSSTLFLCSVLLGAIGFAKKRSRASDALHWCALAILFACLSLDEAISIHERWSAPLRAALHIRHGLFYWAWVIPGALFVGGFALAYGRFLTALPATTRNLFLVAGSLHVGGALGMEMLSGRHYSFYGPDLGYAIIWTVGEILEMLGVLIFLYTLLSYIVSHREEVRVCFEDGENSDQTS